MSIASQLQAIKSAIKGNEDPIRRPITRPSVIFDPKEAADIDLRSILPLAQSGLDALIELDARFSSYNSTIFSHLTLEIDREKMNPLEEKKLNNSLCSYLQLLAGHLHFPFAIRTLEYLIRRYQIHIFNSEELILCALPYHDTHIFVRIVQLIDFGNTKWTFLEGVKTSGAPSPRNVIVQQCIRDKGVLEALCNYASPTKEFQHARPVICFCTAVTVEVLGLIPKLDTDTIQKILIFVFNGLKPSFCGSPDSAAGALMIVGLIATRTTLVPKLVQNLIFFMARFAQHEAGKSSDLSRLRVTIMAMVTLVQSQPSHTFPKKTLLMLKEIKDFVGILFALSKEFDMRKFIRLYVESLVDYSLSDCYSDLFVNLLETFPVNEFLEKIVHYALGQCMKLIHADPSNSCVTGARAKQILAIMSKHYPSDLQGAIHKFVERSKLKLGNENSTFPVFCQMLDGNSDMSIKLSDSKVWFSLEHPKAAVRRAALLDLASFDKLESIVDHPWKLVNIKDAIIRRFLDDDLMVVQAALSINGLSKIVSPPTLLKAYQTLFLRCMDEIRKSKKKSSQACDVAVLCLEHMIFDTAFQDSAMEVANIVFPVIFLLPQSWRVNVKALVLVKKLQWTFFSKIKACDSDFDVQQLKSLDHGLMTTINVGTMQYLAETFAANPSEHIEWLIECSTQNKMTKCLFFFVILRALAICKDDIGKILEIFDTCLVAIKDGSKMLSVDIDDISAHFLKDEWCELKTLDIIVINGELNLERFIKSYMRLANQLLHIDYDTLSYKILICINWCLLEICSGASERNDLNDGHLLLLLDQLFLFFASTSSMSIFKKQLSLLVRNCCKSPFQFLSKYFVEEAFSYEVQVESLCTISSICSMNVSDRSSTNQSIADSLLIFPSLLVPLASDNKKIRAAAVNCVKGLYKLCQCYDASRSKNGSDSLFLQIYTSPNFGDFLKCIISEKRLISSDVNFFPSFLTSLLSKSSDSLVVPEKSHERFDQLFKGTVLLFIVTSALKLSSFGKKKILSLLKTMGSTLLQGDGFKDLLVGLLQKREEYYVESKTQCERLSENDIEMLCLLLEICTLGPNSSDETFGVSCLMKALKVDGLLLDESAVVKPCVTALKNLTGSIYINLDRNIQNEAFIHLVLLYRCDNGDVRTAAREAVLNLNVNCTAISWFLEEIICQCQQIDSEIEKRKMSTTFQSLNTSKQLFDGGEKIIFVLGSLLDILLINRDIVNRISLVRPLFDVLAMLFSTENKFISEFSESLSTVLYPAQHATLIILKDIIDSLFIALPDQEDLCGRLNINLLVKFAHSTKDVTTRNHVFLLLSSVAKISSEWLSEYIVDLFVIVGDSSIKQSDCHSQQVLENLIAVLVPCWLAKSNSVEQLLQIFIKGLPEISENRRITVIMHLVRTLGENDSLGILLYQIFHSLILRLDIHLYSEENYQAILSPLSKLFMEWEYIFASQLCNQYSSKIWLPSLVKLLQEIKHNSKQQEFFPEIFMVLKFIIGKLTGTEFAFEMELARDASSVQGALGALMWQAVLHFQLLSDRGQKHSFFNKNLKEIKNCISQILKTLTTWMNPDTFFNCIEKLLDGDDFNVIKKSLGLLCKFIKEQFHGRQTDTKKPKRKAKLLGFTAQTTSLILPSFSKICTKINQLISSPSVNMPVKLAAISSIEILAKYLPCDEPIFGVCLQSVVEEINSSDFTLSSACIRSTAALIEVLGPQALKQLPCIMENVFKKGREFSICPHLNSNGIENDKVSVLLPTLSALESVIANLGGFLDPYLDDFLDLIILHSDFVSDLDAKITTKASFVRKLLTEKISAHLLLPSLLKVTESALKCGESSLSLVFEMLANMIGAMDRPSVSCYHAKIYEQCLISLNIRHQAPNSIKNVNLVEQSVINAMVVLTMRLTETMFKPLFLHSLEWAETEFEDDQTKKISLDRFISFYSFVDRLVQQHRYLFVPYFKYLIGSSTRYLSESAIDFDSQTPKRKKAKILSSCTNANIESVMVAKLWHLKAIILKALYHCFLYDSSETKFLDASNFQVLLKPIISQLIVEPPTPLNDYSDLPTVEEVDEYLVLCLGQMAVTSKSDVLWKPLNHEVLMQTRNEKVRPKMIGLRVIKYLVEHLREEYLVFLPETIPFLGELLEDAELTVKAMAQDIIREMELLSGESLKQYL